MKVHTRVDGAGEFLSLVPALLGYNPVDSVVIVVFAGKLSHGAMRFDMPADRATVSQLATVATGLVCKVSGATGLAVVVYGDPELAEQIGSELSASTAAAGLHVVDALVVSDRRWARIGTGHEFVELEAVPEQFTGMVGEGDQFSGAYLPDVPQGLVRDIAQQLADGFDNLGAEEMLTLFERALSADPEYADEARLIWCLARPALRDVALVQWTSNIETGAEALSAQLAWETGTEYPAELASVMWGEGPRPDASRLTAALKACRWLAALAPEAERPGVLAAAAWLAWALGMSSHAEVYARQALDINPVHGLAEIVTTMVAAGHLPEWAFVRV